MHVLRIQAGGGRGYDVAAGDPVKRIVKLEANIRMPRGGAHGNSACRVRGHHIQPRVFGRSAFVGREGGREGRFSCARGGAYVVRLTFRPCLTPYR